MNDQNEFLSASALRGISSPSALTLMTALTAAALCPDFYAQEAKPAPAPAAAANSGTNAPVALPEVVVTGTQDSGYKPDAVASPRVVTPLRDTPQTINVVPRQVIEEQNATTLRDVLRNVPGISFQAGEGGVPAGDQMSIRGFSARTDLFVDGVRDMGGYTRDSFNAEQVEVFKGPNSAYSGRGSTGGAVNLVSKTPKLNPIYGATLSYGSSDYYRGTLDFNQPIPALGEIGLEGAAFRLNGLYHDQDFAGRDFVHDNRWALNPTFAIGLGTNTRLTLSYLHLQEDNLAGYGLPFVSNSNNPYGGASAVGKVAPLPYESFLGLRDRDYEKIINDIGGIRLEHDFSEDFTLINNSRYARTDRDSIITAPRIITDPRNDPSYPAYTAGNPNIVTVNGIRYGLNHELQSRDQTTDIFSNQTDLKSKFETGALDHELITSFEYAHEVEENYQRSATIGTAFPYPAELTNPLNPSSVGPSHPYFRTGLRNRVSADTAGLSAFDTVKITDQWLATAGLRGDFVNTSFEQRRADGTVAALDRTDVEPTWRAGLVYKPVPIGSIYFGYGTSFNPSIENQSLNTAVPVAPATLVPLLEPEYGTSYELGTKWDLMKDRLSLSGALFRTDKDNFRTQDPTGLITTTGEVYVQGFELGVSGKITDKWNVYGGYAFMVSEITKSTAFPIYNGTTYSEVGHRLNNTPEQTGSISTTYELPFKLQIGTSFFFVDKRYSNNIETQYAEGYWLEDAFISWKATKNVDIRLNVSNLWDDEYIDRVGGGHAIPGAGRTVILTAAFKY